MAPQDPEADLKDDERAERARIIAVLTETGGNATRAVARLGLSRRALIAKLAMLADLFLLCVPSDVERVHLAALRLSHGDLAELARVLKDDWRDTLIGAGFAHDVHAHEAWVPRPLTAALANLWATGGQVDGVRFRRGEPANLRRRGRAAAEPCVVLSLVALEPEPRFTVRTGKPDPEEILSVDQSWLRPLSGRLDP
jgi:hypothetical protein